MNKDFWMAKGWGPVNEGNEVFNDSSRAEAKRPHQWFVDAAEPELFLNKKQAVQAPNTQSSQGIPAANLAWESPSGFQSVPNQFINRLFGSETPRSIDFTERNISPIGTDNLNISKSLDGHFSEDISVDLSMSHAMDDPEICLGFGGMRKVKVNQVKDSDNRRDNNSDISADQGYGQESENNFISVGQAYGKEEESDTLVARTYNRINFQGRSEGPMYGKGDDDGISLSSSYEKEDRNMISFGGFPDDRDIIPVEQPLCTYDSSYNQAANQISEVSREKTLDESNANTVMTTNRITKPKPESASKNKAEIKVAKKEPPNSFPSNVRSLISTGMLDGVPVKYVSLSREELNGIIKGSGYLCGCKSCNFLKMLNAYEFERHAGSKTKHPNNHIYFENGKTIYQIVQELRNTPDTMLFDTIQTVFGSPINQKAFRIWKESYQAATRELQRIYGKEELNIQTPYFTGSSGNVR